MQHLKLGQNTQQMNHISWIELLKYLQPFLIVFSYETVQLSFVQLIGTDIILPVMISLSVSFMTRLHQNFENSNNNFNPQWESKIIKQAMPSLQGMA